MSNELITFLNFVFEKKTTNTKIAQDEGVTYASRWILNWRDYVKLLEDLGIDASADNRPSLLRYGYPQRDSNTIDDLIAFQKKLRSDLKEMVLSQRLVYSFCKRIFNETNGINVYLTLPETFEADLTPKNIDSLILPRNYETSTYRIFIMAILREMIVDKTLFQLKIDDDDNFFYAPTTQKNSVAGRQLSEQFSSSPALEPTSALPTTGSVPTSAVNQETLPNLNGLSKEVVSKVALEVAALLKRMNYSDNTLASQPNQPTQPINEAQNTANSAVSDGSLWNLSEAEAVSEHESCPIQPVETEKSESSASNAVELEAPAYQKIAVESQFVKETDDPSNLNYKLNASLGDDKIVIEPLFPEESSVVEQFQSPIALDSFDSNQPKLDLDFLPQTDLKPTDAIVSKPNSDNTFIVCEEIEQHPIEESPAAPTVAQEAQTASDPAALDLSDVAAKQQGFEAEELKVQELKVEELKAQELKAEELRAQELKAQELKAQELEAEELKAQELGSQEQEAQSLETQELKLQAPKAQELKPQASNVDALNADLSDDLVATFASQFFGEAHIDLEQEEPIELLERVDDGSSDAPIDLVDLISDENQASTPTDGAKKELDVSSAPELEFFPPKFELAVEYRLSTFEYRLFNKLKARSEIISNRLPLSSDNIRQEKLAGF
jgi:hypothetical protein